MTKFENKPIENHLIRPNALGYNIIVTSNSTEFVRGKKFYNSVTIYYCYKIKILWFWVKFKKYVGGFYIEDNKPIELKSQFVKTYEEANNLLIPFDLVNKWNLGNKLTTYDTGY